MRSQASIEVRQLILGLSSFLLCVAPAYAKHAKMPLPQQVTTAKTIYIDNRSGIANIGDRAYDELQKWARFQIVDSAEKADLVLLISASQYVSGYSSVSNHNTTGTIDDAGNLNAQTYGHSTSDAIVSGTTYVTVLDPKTGTALWSDARPWGKCVFAVCKSATRGIIKELRYRVDEQEGHK
jgi:hypothetical protein